MAEVAPGSIDPSGVQTNIVIADVSVAGWTASDFVAAALERGVRLYAVGAAKVRFVWHLDVDDAATDHAISVVRDLLLTRERTVRAPAGR
jgi:threonine aldolase